MFCMYKMELQGLVFQLPGVAPPLTDICRRMASAWFWAYLRTPQDQIWMVRKREPLLDGRHHATEQRSYIELGTKWLRS